MIMMMMTIRISAGRVDVDVWLGLYTPYPFQMPFTP